MTLNALLVDDDKSFRTLVERRLRSFISDLNTTTADDLASVRKIIGASPRPEFDLVVLDQHLPDGKGTDLLAEGHFEGLAVLSVSSDTAPELPGAHLQAGAAYFLNKREVSEPLFKPLVLGILDRNRLQRELQQAQIERTRLETVRTLVSTLRHEINNPLGAVLGAAYILQHTPQINDQQRENAKTVEASARRIKHVLDQLCDTFALAPVDKAQHRVFHIPGDKPWEDK